MKTSKDIAQWVIDNRYPKNENEKVSDMEMYHELVENIEKLLNTPPVTCRTCKYQDLSGHDDPCYQCWNFSEYDTK